MKYTLNPDVVLVSVLDENMLTEVDTAAGGLRSMRSVNESGAYFWKLLEDGLDTDEIEARASADFSIPAKLAESVLTEYLQSLQSAGYLKLLSD